MKELVIKENGYQADIRKIQFGLSVKTDSMTFIVGERYNLGSAGSATVHHIEEIKPEIYVVYIKKGESIIPWKKGSMPCMVEYSQEF